MKNRKIFLNICTFFCLSATIFGICSLNSVLAEESTENNAVSPASLWTVPNGVEFTGNTKSPDFFTIGVYNNRITHTADNPFWIPEHFKTGIEVNVTTGNMEIAYNNVIDLNSIDGSTPLLDWVPIAATRGTHDISNFSIRLDDVDDENNYLEMYFQAPATGSAVQMGFDFPGRDKKVTYTWNHGGMNNLPRWHADPMNSIVKPFSISFDVNSNTMTASIYDGNPQRTGTVSMNLSDITNYGSNGFKGFKNNRVRLTVNARSLASSSAKYMLFNIAGISMSGANVVDTTKPSLRVEEPVEVARAYTGKEYKLFKAEAFDLVDGSLDYEIRLLNPGVSLNNYTENDYQVVTEDSFVTTQEGTYILIYLATDKAGNTTQRLFRIESAHNWYPLSVSVEPFSNAIEGAESTMELGMDIFVPEYTVSGGSGCYTVEEKVYYLVDNTEVEVFEKNINIKKAGSYKLCIYVTDYCGNTTIENVYFDVVSNGLPVIKDTLNMNKIFYNKIPVELPTVEVYDYNTYVGIIARADLKVEAVGENNSKTTIYDSTKDGERIAFYPDKDIYGDEVKLRYIYKCAQDSFSDIDKCLVQEYLIPIAEKPTDLIEYFYSDEDILIKGNTAEEYATQSRYLSFTAKNGIEGSTFGYVNPVAAEFASVQLQFDYEGQKFTDFVIRFIDAFNADIGFEVKLYKYGGSTYVNKCYLSHSGTSYVMSGGFEPEDGNYGTAGKTAIAVSYSNGQIFDYGGTKICDVGLGIDGQEFKGFPSGAVKMQFEFLNSKAGASVKINKIADQNMMLFYKKISGVYVKSEFKDNLKPIIVIDTESKKNYTLGEIVSVPSAAAFDTICSGIFVDGKADVLRIMVEVRNPDRSKVVIDKCVWNENLKFSIEEYGNYLITYYVVDNDGRTSTDSLSVGVLDDVSPTITLSNETSLIGIVGNEINLPTMIVLDNYSPLFLLESYVFVITPKGLYVPVKLAISEKQYVYASYTPEYAGEYKVIYYAIDNDGNSTTRTYKFTVKEGN